MLRSLILSAAAGKGPTQEKKIFRWQGRWKGRLRDQDGSSAINQTKIKCLIILPSLKEFRKSNLSGNNKHFICEQETNSKYFKWLQKKNEDWHYSEARHGTFQHLMEWRLTAGFLKSALPEADTSLGLKWQWENDCEPATTAYGSLCLGQSWTGPGKTAVKCQWLLTIHTLTSCWNQQRCLRVRTGEGYFQAKLCVMLSQLQTWAQKQKARHLQLWLWKSESIFKNKHSRPHTWAQHGYRHQKLTQQFGFLHDMSFTQYTQAEMEAKKSDGEEETKMVF